MCDSLDAPILAVEYNQVFDVTISLSGVVRYRQVHFPFEESVAALLPLAPFSFSCKWFFASGGLLFRARALSGLEISGSNSSLRAAVSVTV